MRAPLPKPKFHTAPENEGKRTRAYELWLTSNVEGKVRSLRSIAQELGVANNAVQTWKATDAWDAKLSKTLTQSGRAAELTVNSLRMKIRSALLVTIDRLHKLAEADSTEPAAVAAIAKTLTEMALRHGAMDLGEAQPTTATAEWQDDVTPEEDPSQPTAPSSVPPEPPLLTTQALEELERQAT